MEVDAAPCRAHSLRDNLSDDEGTNACAWYAAHLPVLAIEKKHDPENFLRLNQYSGHELSEMLREAGFKDIRIKPTFGYLSIVTGVKP